MSTENQVIRFTFKALQDMRANADLGRVVGRLPGTDGVQFITDANSAMLALGVLETNAPSLSDVTIVAFGMTKVHFSSACSAGYSFTIGVSGGVTPIVNVTSAYVKLGTCLGPYGTIQLGNVSSDGFGTCWVDFIKKDYCAVSLAGAIPLQFV